jgi:hypothetical protein
LEKPSKVPAYSEKFFNGRTTPQAEHILVVFGGFRVTTTDGNGSCFSHGAVWWIAKSFGEANFCPHRGHLGGSVWNTIMPPP